MRWPQSSRRPASGSVEASADTVVSVTAAVSSLSIRAPPVSGMAHPPPAQEVSDRRRRRECRLDHRCCQEEPESLRRTPGESERARHDKLRCLRGQRDDRLNQLCGHALYGPDFSPGVDHAGRAITWMQNCRAEPLTHPQCEFHVVAVLGHGAAKALLGLADPVLDCVLVQHEALGGGLIAAPALQEDQQGLAQASVVIVIGSQARERTAHPAAEQVSGSEHHRDGGHLGERQHPRCR